MSSILPDKNASATKAVDAYIARSAGFAQPVLRHLREIVHEAAPAVTEAIKWSMPFFVYNGVILGNMAAFKAHCSFGLWGTQVTGTLRKEGVAQGGSMGSFGKITSIDDLPARSQMLSYVRLAAKALDDGVRTKAWSRPKVAKAEAVVPETLAAALKENKPAAKQWATMSPSCKREYCAWIADARRDETRDKRVMQSVGWIAEGKSRNWKYEKT
jgi:uncharacterized protein YdeI (YjbR/CyaY-like superfamily)